MAFPEVLLLTKAALIEQVSESGNHCLAVLGDYMRENGYTRESNLIDWAVNRGDSLAIEIRFREVPRAILSATIYTDDDIVGVPSYYQSPSRHVKSWDPVRICWINPLRCFKTPAEFQSLFDDFELAWENGLR